MFALNSRERERTLKVFFNRNPLYIIIIDPGYYQCNQAIQISLLPERFAYLADNLKILHRVNDLLLPKLYRIVHLDESLINKIIKKQSRLLFFD